MDWNWWQFAPLIGVAVVAVIVALCLRGFERKIQQALRDCVTGTIRRGSSAPPVSNNSKW